MRRLFHLSAAPAGTPPTQRKNFLNVQIDAIGVGLVSAASPFLPVFLTRLGATNFQVGLLTAMPALAGLFLAIVIGRFLQSRRNIVPWFSGASLLYFSSYALAGLVSLVVPRQYVVWAILLIWAAATLPQIMRSVAFSVVMNAVAGPKGRYALMSRRWSILGFTSAITVMAVGQILNRLSLPINYQLVFIGLWVGGAISYYFTRQIELPDVAPQPHIAGLSLPQRFNGYVSLVRGEGAFVSFMAKRLVYTSGSTSPPPFSHSTTCARCRRPTPGSGSSTPLRRQSCWWAIFSGRARGGSGARVSCSCGPPLACRCILRWWHPLIE